jgi:hypothetical protein
MGLWYVLYLGCLLYAYCMPIVYYILKNINFIKKYIKKPTYVIMWIEKHSLWFCMVWSYDVMVSIFDFVPAKISNDSP